MGEHSRRSATIPVKERLSELGLELPPPMRLKGQRFEPVRIAGDRVIIAGHLPVDGVGALAGPFGKVGAEVSPDQAYRAARRIALGMMASLEAAGVDLDRVEWRKALGMVNAAPGFNALPDVVDGFSDLLLEVFGDRGRHSRSAIGVAELPFGAPVEVEAEIALLPAESAVAPTADARPEESGRAPGLPKTPTDPGLRGVDYAGISPLTLPAEALIRAIKALSNLFWISIAGTVLTIFLAALANLGGAVTGSLAFGEYSIPVSVLPIGCLSFAMFMFWLTSARLRMLDTALGDDDLTANLARDIFRLDPPVLDVFDAANLRPFALLSGFSMLLWNWSLFFGSSVGLIFSATIIQGAAASVDEFPVFAVYFLVTLGIMAYGANRVVGPLRRILDGLHGERLKVGVFRILVAVAVMLAGILTTRPDLLDVMTAEEWRYVGPSSANAIDGETLMLEQGEIVVLAGIEALRPGQTCSDAQGAVYPCGHQATTYLQSLVQDRPVHCFVAYPQLGICAPVDEGAATPSTLADSLNENNLQALMVAAGYAFTEGVGTDYMGTLQDEAQRKRVGAWQGTFEPPQRWAARQGGP